MKGVKIYVPAKVLGKLSELELDAGGKRIENIGLGDTPDDVMRRDEKIGDYEVYGLFLVGLAADRPAPGIVDRFYFSTDTLVLERDAGVAWVEVVRGEAAIRLAHLTERAHGSLTGIGTDDHHAKYTDAEALAQVEAAGLALATGKNIKVISALTANNTWSGVSGVLTAGEVLALGNAVYLKGADSRTWKALATGTGTMPGIALATCATEAGTAYEFLLLGFMRHDAWSWSPGGLFYVDRTTAGGLTQTAPTTTGDQVQVLGVAITADIIYLCPSLELVEIS